jgi:DNA ligase-1
VLEVAFEDVQVSTRHPAGFALRFPRIVRRRHDLSVSDIGSVNDLLEMYEQARTPTVEAG